jgi:hypothetical protein
MSPYMPARYASSLDLQSRRLSSTVCAMIHQILLVALMVDLHQPQLTSRSYSDLLSLRRSPADFTPAAKYLCELMRRTLLPRMGYREATTHIQLCLLGALISHSEFNVVDFLICEIEDTILDGLRARRQLPYAHYLCHIFV